MRKHAIIGIITTLVVLGFAAMIGNKSSAAVTTPTKLGIRTGVLSFYKDTGSTMDSYFSHAANSAADINLGTYDSVLEAITAISSGDHRFTVSDLAGRSFHITIQSSNLSGTDTSEYIAASAVSYTGTTRAGTGKALTINPTSAADLSSAINFVGRANNAGVSKFSQEITLSVAIPAAQTPDTYNGTLTFDILNP